MKIRVATRDSPLAVQQTRQLLEEFKSLSDIDFELVPLKTKGDLNIQDRFEKIGGKGLFTKELDQALIEKRADIAVHSLKDIPSELPQEIAVVGIGKEENQQDVWISYQYKTLSEVPHGSLVGTSSARRVAQLFGLYPHIKAVPMRGNLQTRLEKMKEQELAGIILAASGMIRMGYIDQIQDYISLDHFVPAVGQGYLGITGRKEDSFEFLSNWQDALVWTKMTALRTMLVQLEGGCSVPFGAAWNGDHLNVFLSDLAGEKKIQKKIPFHESHQKTVDQMLNELYAEGAKDIIERIRSGR